MCDAILNLDMIKKIYSVQINFMSKMCCSTLTTYKEKRYVTLSDVEVTKLTLTTFEDWHTTLTSVVGRQTSLSGIYLYYLLHYDSVGYYKLNWTTIEKKIHHYISLTGQRF